MGDSTGETGHLIEKTTDTEYLCKNVRNYL